MSYTRRRPWGTQKPPLGYQLDRSSPFAQGLVGCWLFNEGAGRSTNLCNMDKTVDDGTSWIPSGFGIAKSLNGTTDRIDAINNIDFTNRAMSIVTSVLVNAYQCRPFVVHNSANTASALFLEIAASTGVMQMNRLGTTQKYRNSASQIPVGIWQTLCCVDTDGGDDANSMHFYKNAILDDSATKQNGAVQTSATGKWSIGGIYYLDVRNLKGMILYTYVYNRALSAAEVAALYAEPYLMVEGWNYGRYYSIPSGINYIPHIENYYRQLRAS